MLILLQKIEPNKGEIRWKNKMIMDKITTLRLLHGVRANMQKYAAGQSSSQVCKNLIEGYSAFSTNKNLSQDVYKLISSYVTDIVFDANSFKTTSAKDDSKRTKDIEKSKTQNKATALLQKQILEELEYQQSRGKMTDVPADAVFENISANEQYFTVKVAGRDEPLQFAVRQNKGKHFSSLGVKALNDKAYAKKGFNENTFKLLSSLGEKGVTLEEMKVENAGKKYTASQYKSYLGLSAKDELSDMQSKELDILNSLAATDQANFIVGVKKRTLEQARHQAFFDALNKEENPLKLLADREKLSALFAKIDMADCAQTIQDNFIKKQIQPDKKNLWNNFTKNPQENSRFSNYDILMQRIISSNAEIFKDIYNFNSRDEMKEKIKDATKKIKHLSVPSLGNDFAAEILARGIFCGVLNKHTNKEKLQNMNLLLNELGLNLRFDTVKVTKAPDMSIETAQQQSRIDREAFEKDKKSALSKKQEADFNKKLRELGINHPDFSSQHHFWALKYNPFIDKELNQSKNYVQTAREHPWNLDGHDMVHVFDTAGEFWVVNEQQKLYFMDFNSLRKAFNSGKKLMLQIPILQVKNAQGKFVDLLKVSEKDGECGMYISTDKTSRDFIRLPDYCLGSGGGRGGKDDEGR